MSETKQWLLGLANKETFGNTKRGRVRPNAQGISTIRGGIKFCKHQTKFLKFLYPTIQLFSHLLKKNSISWNNPFKGVSHGTAAVTADQELDSLMSLNETVNSTLDLRQGSNKDLSSIPSKQKRRLKTCVPFPAKIVSRHIQAKRQNLFIISYVPSCPSKKTEKLCAIPSNQKDIKIFLPSHTSNENFTLVFYPF